VHAPYSLARAAFLVALVLTPSAFASTMNGWRTGGTGVAKGALPSIVGQPGTAVRWKTKTKSWANASPVRFGSMICITEEPVALACFDADTGQRKWSANNRYIDTLPPAKQQSMQSTLDLLKSDGLRQSELQTEMGKVQRNLRRSNAGPEVQERYQELMNELSLIADRQKNYSEHILSDENGLIGYATPTPTVFDGNIYALFGNGVLSKFSENGDRKWSVFLGPPLRPMRGYHTGNAASVLVADGVVLAPFGKLRGVDPATGSVLWTGPDYPHYGTPAIAHVGDTTVVVTPGGELIAPKTGTEIGDPITDIEYIGPVASNNRVFVAGSTRYQDQTTGSHATAYTLQKSSNGRITATMDWDKPLNKDRVYATPLISDGRLYVLYLPGRMDVLSTESGATLSTLDSLPRSSNGSPSPTLGGDRMVIGFEKGVLLMFRDGDTPQQIGQAFLENHRATPLLDGQRIYIRGFQYLYCID